MNTNIILSNATAGVAIIIPNIPNKYSKINNDNKRELVEFRLGYSSRGYTEFCKKCRGFTKDNDSVVKPAVQVKGN